MPLYIVLYDKYVKLFLSPLKTMTYKDFYDKISAFQHRTLLLVVFMCDHDHKD